MFDVLGQTGSAAIATGGLGAAIKILAGFLKIMYQSKQDQRAHDLALAGKQKEFKKLGPDPNSSFVSWTRRVLAWGFGLTFCTICILWACFPNVEIVKAGGTRTVGFNLLIINFQHTRDLVSTYTSGSIVWELIPFLTMIMMTYMTPDISKYR